MPTLSAEPARSSSSSEPRRSPGFARCVPRCLAGALLAAAFVGSACAGDELGGDQTPAVVTQTIPRPATSGDAFTFERTLRVDWTSRIEAVRLEVQAPTGASLDPLDRVEIRAVTAGTAVPVIDVFGSAFRAGSGRHTVTVSPAVAFASIAGYGATDDFDADFVPNERDNCPQVQNATQADGDGDGVGAACDPDDQDPAVGAGANRAGLPPVTLRFRVFSQPGQMPDEGLQLGTTLLGGGKLQVQL